MLNLETLKKGLVVLMTKPEADFVKTGKRWASIYKDYAQGAMSIPGSSPITLQPAADLMATQLAVCFATSKSLITTADSITAALSAFWPAVQFSPVPPAGPGLPAPTGAGALSAGLKLLLPIPDPNGAAYNIAVVIDAFTRLVMVTHPSPTGPITSPLS
jgi:hypothetical protein